MTHSPVRRWVFSTNSLQAQLVFLEKCSKYSVLSSGVLSPSIPYVKIPISTSSKKRTCLRLDNGGRDP